MWCWAGPPREQDTSWKLASTSLWQATVKMLWKALHVNAASPSPPRSSLPAGGRLGLPQPEQHPLLSVVSDLGPLVTLPLRATLLAKQDVQ